MNRIMFVLANVNVFFGIVKKMCNMKIVKITMFISMRWPLKTINFEGRN